jgi:hypothetical protein
MNITVLGLATACMLLAVSAALAADQATQQGGVSTSPGVVGGRTPAETPPATGLLPGSPGPYKSEGASSPPVSSGSSTAPASPSGSASQSSGSR